MTGPATPPPGNPIIPGEGDSPARDLLSLTPATTSYPRDAETADDLFKKADDRLFAAKLVRPLAV